MPETEIQYIAIDFDSPHRLGERPEKEYGKPKWLATDDETFSSCQSTKIIKELPSGLYGVFQDQRGGFHAARMYPETDALYDLPNPVIEKVRDEVEVFWAKHEEFNTYKIKHKRGILLHGAPGIGKTSTINILASALIKDGGLVFTASNINEVLWFAEFANRHLRVIEPSRPAILIIEDIDKMMDGGNSESMLLNFMDGENSVNHLITIGTTNRFKELNDLILRPSRFDTHIEMESPIDVVRTAYLVKKGLTQEEAESWSSDTEGMSLAELKELFVSVKLLGFSLEIAKTRITNQTKAVKNTTFTNKKAPGVGFSFNPKT